MMNKNELNSGHILIVEADTLYRQMLKEGIKFFGYEFSAAGNATEALRILDEKDIDVVITDIRLPDMNGLELAGLAKDKYHSDVVVITGLYEKYSYEEAIHRGASDFVEKPIKLTELVVRLQRVLRERKLIFKQKQAINALQESGTKLRFLSSQLIKAQEKERKRISLELHDEMGQSLTAINLNIKGIEKELPSSLSPKAKEKFEETYSIIEQASEQIRELSLFLRPAMLDDLGLIPTLRWYLNGYGKRANVPVEFDTINFTDRINSDIETLIYRIIQEALNNTAKHSQAKKISICIERKNKNAYVTIKDDGKGFDKSDVFAGEAPANGIGLLGMQERVNMTGGHFSVQSSKGAGTRIEVEIPLR